MAEFFFFSSLLFTGKKCLLQTMPKLPRNFLPEHKVPNHKKYITPHSHRTRDAAQSVTLQKMAIYSIIRFCFSLLCENNA